MDLDFAADGNLRELSGEKAWEAIENFPQCQKEWDIPPNIISEQELVNLKAQTKRLFRNEKVWVEMHRGISWDKVENPSPQSTPQVLPSFKVNIPPVTYSKEDLVLNTCNHDIPLSTREVPSFDELKPQPQPLPNCPSLDVSLQNKRGPELPIKPLSPDSFRMKVVDPLTIHTPSSPHEEPLHPKDIYFYYDLCIVDPKKHYGFKLGLLGQSGSLGVDFLNLEVIENNFLRGFSLPVKPNELGKGRI
ncbi:hypothetical protein Tco_0867466 [Tanacetum coccineum]